VENLRRFQITVDFLSVPAAYILTFNARSLLAQEHFINRKEIAEGTPPSAVYYYYYYFIYLFELQMSFYSMTMVLQ
jgi:hypothetical protein